MLSLAYGGGFSEAFNANFGSGQAGDQPPEMGADAEWGKHGGASCRHLLTVRFFIL